LQPYQVRATLGKGGLERRRAGRGGCSDGFEPGLPNVELVNDRETREPTWVWLQQHFDGILAKMREALAQSRENISAFAPRIVTMAANTKTAAPIVAAM